MNSSFMNLYFIIIIALIIVFNIVQFYQISPNISEDILIPNFHFSENSNYFWPIPRLSQYYLTFWTKSPPNN